MHYIYCYINKVNNHKYVGQTNNLQRRKREHYSASFNPKSSSYNDLIHYKIRQYGINNFDVIVLEKLYTDDINIVNEREQFWIKELNTFRGNGQGYNSDLGGCAKARSSVLTKEQLLELKNDLAENKLSYLELQGKYNVSNSFISSINNGVYWKDDNREYPIRKYVKADSDYDDLIDLLLNSDLSYQKIADTLGLGVSTVKKINYGTLRHGLYPSYPIRKISPQKRKAKEIIKLLQEGKRGTEIAEQVGVSLTTIVRVNAGQSYADENLKYPIVKNPL